MWRSFALATAIVLAAIVAILALPQRRSERTQSPRYTSGTGTPGPAQRDEFRHPAAQPVTGNAPWALSALPACFRQRSSASGPPAFVRAKIPRGARRVRGNATLRVADCRLDVRAETALVTRGDNRLLIPRIARFYVVRDRLILDRQDGNREEVRVYTLAGGALPAFAQGDGAAKP